MEQRILPLSEADIADISSKRKWMLGHYDSEAEASYASIEAKLNLIATILRNGWIAPNETVELQCLGVTFGDALVQQLGMRWVAVEDEYGRDPALVLDGTSILMFPLTSISKRIEAGEQVNVHDLFRHACATVARIQGKQ